MRGLCFIRQVSAPCSGLRFYSAVARGGHHLLAFFDLLECKGNYSATSNNIKLVHWPLMGGYICYNEEGTGRGRSSPRSLLTVPKVTAYPLTASVPITVLLYNGPLLGSFNVPMKGYITLHYITLHYIT